MKAVVSAWVAFVAALLLALPQPPRPSFVIIGAALGFILIAIGGLLLGWVFWRWGLAQAICGHFAGDLVVQALSPRVL